MLVVPNPDALDWQGHPPPVAASGGHYMADRHQPGGLHPATWTPQPLPHGWLTSLRKQI